MSLHRIVALFRRVTLEIVRDRPSLALLFIAPLVMSGLITFIIREGDTPTIDAVLVNQAGLPGTLVAAQLGTALEGGGRLVRDPGGRGGCALGRRARRCQHRRRAAHRTGDGCAPHS